jgi:hypothetical protein
MSERSGPEPDDFLQELARDLMQAIGKSLHQSEQVQQIVEQIETEGYRVALVLAALTRLVAQEGRAGGSLVSGSLASAGLEGVFEGAEPAADATEFDREFLRKVGIRGDLPA